MDAQIVAALIGAAATMLAAIIAAAIIMHQVRRQSRDSLQQTRDNERLKLKLSIYTEIISICRRVEDAEIELGTKLRILRHSVLPIWREPRRWSGFRPQAYVTGPQLLDLSAELQAGAASVITLTEQWQIVDRRLDLFRMAVHSASHDIRESWTKLYAKIFEILPPARTDPDSPLPPNERLLEIENHCEEVIDRISVLSTYVTDFQAEMQNLLLSDLFDHEVPSRQPRDARFKPLRLSDYDELKAYFENDTPWGKQCASVNESVRTQTDSG